MTDGLSNTTAAAMDLAGQTITSTNARGQVTTYGHDGVGQVVSVTYQDPKTPNVSYTKSSRRAVAHQRSATALAKGER